MSSDSNGAARRAEEILAWTRAHLDEMASLLAELVALPTENPPGKNYRSCAELLEKRLVEAGLACERFEPSSGEADSNGGAVCLEAGYGQGERTLYFHGHYDVVPAQSAEQFEPRREGHFLFGRGSCDMKGGIVAMLYAIRGLKECGAELNGRVGLTLVPDEETGGARGSNWLTKQGLLGRSGIGMLTAEPTSGVVWNANRGAITLKVEVLGKAAHVGLQHQGENAFERMHRVVEKLLELKREVEQRRTGHKLNMQDHKEDRTANSKPGARNSILMLGGQSGGGTNFNVVPERCWFTVDRRINPEEDLRTEKTRLLGVLEECRRSGIPVEWEILQEGRSAGCSEKETLGEALTRNVKAVAGESPRFELCPGLLETRYYAAQGMPAYAYGPGLLSVAHGPKEYVDLRKMADCAAIYALTAMQMLKK